MNIQCPRGFYQIFPPSISVSLYRLRLFLEILLNPVLVHVIEKRAGVL